MSVEQVLDGRPGCPVIGMVHRGLENQQAAVLFREGMEAELTAWLQKQLPSAPPKPAMVVCVRQLRVGEVLNGITEMASADFAADVCVRLPDGYHFVRSMANRTSARALEITARHAPHLAQLLQSCLQQLQAADWTRAAQRPVRTLAQLPTDKPATGVRPAVLRAPAPRQGIYRSFDQFLTNQPDTTVQLQLAALQLHAVGGKARYE